VRAKQEQIKIGYLEQEPVSLLATVGVHRHKIYFRQAFVQSHQNL